MFYVVKHEGVGTVDVFPGGDLTALLRDVYPDDLAYILERDPTLHGQRITFRDLPDYLDVDIYDDVADATARAIDAWEELLA